MTAPRFICRNTKKALADRRPSIHDKQTELRIPAALSHPSRCNIIVPRSSEGTGNAGRASAPIDLREKKTRKRLLQVRRIRSGIPCANGFNGFLRALVSRRSARMCKRAVLTNRPSLDLSPFVLKGL